MTTLRLMIPIEWDANKYSCEWLILGRQGQVLSRGKDILGAFPQCDETEIIVPASMVGFILAQLPPGNRSKVLAALPFLVEGSLISTPEDTHAVLAEESGNEVIVAVIQKSWVKCLVERLARIEIFPTRMFPETLLPNLPNEGWSMVCRGSESFIRTSASQGFSLNIDSENELPPFVLILALRQAKVLPLCIVMYGEIPKHVANWSIELGVKFITATQQEWLVNNSKPEVNLLQGEFQPSGRISRHLIAFKPAVISLAFLLVMQITFSVLDYAVKVRESRKLDQDMLTLFKATFPDASAVVDAPLQMQRNLDDLKHGAGQSGTSDFMQLLSTVTASIGAIPSERLKDMGYQNGKLVLHLLMPDMEQAKLILQRLNNSGLNTIIENPLASAQGIELQLVISASPS